jgi:dienelactone hydrolase
MVLLLGACTTTERLPANYEPPEPIAAAIVEQFCYVPAEIVAETTLARESNSYRVFEVSMPARLEGDDDDTLISFEFYEQRAGGPSPVVLLLPILNGQKHLMRPFATYFAAHGYSAVIVDTVQRKSLLEDMIDPEPAIRRTIQRHRRVIDWIESRPDLDNSKIGVFGASLGGFNALFLAASDDRVSAVVPALAGGSLAEVLVTSDERRIKLAVEGVKDELGLDDSQLLGYLQEKIQTDTLVFGKHIHADRVLMVLAEHDDAVPYERQLELREAMAKPEAITLPTGHISAAAYLPYLRSKTFDFFDRKFSEPSAHGTASLPADTCSAFEQDIKQAPLLDRTQTRVYDVINGAAQYFDSFFGGNEVAETSNVSRGSMSVSGQQDQRNGFRQSVRLRARVALPALQERTQLILGRGDSDDMINGTAYNNADTLPGRFSDFEDEDWLIGVGFARNQVISKGWHFSAGVKVRSPLEPYVRATYRWNKTIDDAWLWQVRPLVFAQSQRGTGGSLTNTLDFAANSKWMFRSWSVLQGEDDIEGLGWTQQLTAFQRISDKVAMSYNLFATGETDADEPLRDYGLELRFRRRISRDWLFMELLTFATWPREDLLETRERNLGVGIEFEMQFGDWPGRPQRRQPGVGPVERADLSRVLKQSDSLSGLNSTF